MTAVLPDQDTETSKSILDVLGSIEFRLGTQLEESRKDRKQRTELLNAIYPVFIPAQTTTATGGVALLASAEVLGPRSGNVWDVRRVSIWGLASTSETINLYRVSSPVAASAVGQNYIATITGPAGTYSPGLGALLLRPNESIMAYNTGLTSTDVITMTADGINVAQPWLGAYLL